MPRVKPSPITLIAGRSRTRRDDQLLREALAGAGKGHPAVAYIGAASGDDPGFFRMLAGKLKNAGAGAVRLAPLAGERVDVGEAREILAMSDVVFLSGGDVEAGMRRLRAAKLADFLAELHARGRTFLGISAGSIMLSEQWLRWSDPEDAATAELFPCLGLAPIRCDTHDEDEDWEELRALLELTGEDLLGYGIPSGGALWVSPEGKVAALARPAARFRRAGGRLRRLEDLAPME